MFYSALLCLLVGVSAEYVKHENPADSNDEHGSQTDSNLIGKGGYPPNTRSHSNSGSGYDGFPTYRAHGDYLVPSVMFPYQQRTRTPVTSPEVKQRSERRHQYDGQDIPNPNYGGPYLRPGNAYPRHGNYQNSPPLRTGNYPPFYSNVLPKKDGYAETYVPKRPAYPLSPAYPQYPRYNQRTEPEYRGQPSGQDDRFRNQEGQTHDSHDHPARGPASEERPGPTGSDNRYPSGDSIQDSGRPGTQKVEYNADFNAQLRKNGFLPQNSNKLDMKYLETLLGNNKAFGGKAFRQSEFDLGALYSKDSNSAPRADLSKLFSRDGSYKYVRNDGGQKGDLSGRHLQSPRQPAYYPSQSRQPAYYPSQPRQPAYYPSQSRQPANYPSQPRQPAYYPSQPRQPANYPSQPRQPANYPSQPRQPSYYPSQPRQPANYPSQPRQPAYYPSQPRQPANYPSQPRQPAYYPTQPRQPADYPRQPPTSSRPGKLPPYYFEPKRPTLYPQQPINTDQPRQPPPGGETKVPADIQNGIPLTSEQIQELFGQGVGKTSGRGGNQQGQEGEQPTPGQVGQVFEHLPGGGTSQQPQDGGQQGRGDQSSEQGQTGSGGFDFQLPTGGKQGGVRVLTLEEVQRLFGKQQAQDPRRGNNPSGPQYQGEGGQLPTPPNGRGLGNRNQMYRGGRDDQYQPYAGGRNTNFQPARGGGSAQYPPPREGTYYQYPPVSDGNDNQYQPARDGNTNNNTDAGSNHQYRPINRGQGQYAGVYGQSNDAGR